MSPAGETTPLIERLAWHSAKLIVLRASRLGDFLLAVPALRALRGALPGVEITYIGLPRVEALVQRCPYIDRFEPFPGFPGIAEQFFDPRRVLAFLERIQADEFELAIQLHGSGRHGNRFAALLPAKMLAGFCRGNEVVPWMDLTVPYAEQGHEIDRLLALTEALGAPTRGRQVEFPVLPADERELEVLIEPSASSPLVVCHPGAEVVTKCWPAERFAELGRRISEQYGAHIVVTGLASEQPLTHQVVEGCGAKATDAAGSLSLGGLGALLQRAALVVTNDTLTAHIAYALQIPSITLFGPQDPARWGSLDPAQHLVIAHGVECRPCDVEPCPHEHVCMNEITVDEVMESVAKLLTR